MMNPMKLLKLKGCWERFTLNHPKFPQFINAVQTAGLNEGTIIEIKIITEEGKTLSTNVKINQSDKELFTELSEMMKTT